MNDILLDFLNRQDVDYKRIKVSSISSIGIGGMATVVVPRNDSELIKIIDFLSFQEIGYKIVGRMTNILPCDDEYTGLIIQTKRLSSVLIGEDDVKVETGAPLSLALVRSMHCGLGGAEALYGIPGSVGGMTVSNAGAYGAEMSEFITRVEAYDPTTRKRIVLTNGELGFSYRHSVFKERDLIVLSVALALVRKNTALIKEGFDHYSALRRSSQPVSEPSLGSIFKRRDGTPISYLIDKAGLKGLTVGGAAISDKHAGFIVNRGGASALDVIRLIDIIKDAIYKKYGIMPEEEIEYLKGKFT